MAGWCGSHGWAEEGDKIPEAGIRDDQVNLVLEFFVFKLLAIRTQRPHNKQSLTTLKPKLRAFMDKYASTTIDPVELIKKYHRSKKRMDQKTEGKFASEQHVEGKEEEANRKYPTKFLHSEKAETTTKSATNDAFPRYTTSASFRRKPSDDKSQSSATTKRYGHKLAVTERAGEEPWWADLQRKTRWEMLQEVEVEEDEEVVEEVESRREERRKKQRQQEEWRRDNLERRKEEELKAEEERQDEIWWQLQQRRESSRRAAQSRVQLDQQRQEDGRRRAGEEDNGSGLEFSTIHLEFMDLLSLILMI